MIRATSVLALLSGACYTPAYETLRSRGEMIIGTLCSIYSEVNAWAAGDNAYVITAKCEKVRVTPTSDGHLIRTNFTSSVALLCQGMSCTELAGTDDLATRVGTAVLPPPPVTVAPPSAVPPQSTSVVSEADGGEAQIRKQIDALAPAILACTNNETTVVQVEIRPDRTSITLTGKLVRTPTEGCVRAALAGLKPPAGGRAPFTVLHPVMVK